MKQPLLSLIVLALIVASCTSQGEPIKIGAVLPLSGERADDAQSVKNGIDMAATEINQRHLLNGPIRVIYTDSRCDSNEAENAAVHLVLAEGVRAIIGDICPEATHALAQIAASNNAVVLNLAPNMTSDSTIFSITDTTSLLFIKLYERVYNNTPDHYAAQGYNALKSLGEALQETDYTGRKLSAWFNSEHIQN
ncbi:ABC transporter substrate-binding protein [Candidatus Woesearchaeota archaeon]|nr:ABC transporter substrate-binding protein [Candidatus Woesearchaeota archaeon]